MTWVTHRFLFRNDGGGKRVAVIERSEIRGSVAIDFAPQSRLLAITFSLWERVAPGEGSFHPELGKGLVIASSQAPRNDDPWSLRAERSNLHWPFSFGDCFVAKTVFPFAGSSIHPNRHPGPSLRWDDGSGIQEGCELPRVYPLPGLRPSPERRKGPE